MMEWATYKFSWQRAANDVQLQEGYRWRDGVDVDPKLELVLTSEEQGEQYEPLDEETGLFKIFAAMKPTPEEVLGFAKRFGLLGCPQQIFIPATRVHEIGGRVRAKSQPRRKPVNWPGQTAGEPLTEWFFQIDEMRCVTELWQLIQNRRVTELRRRITLNSRNKKTPLYIRYSAESPAFSGRRPPSFFFPASPAIPPSDLLGHACTYLSQKVEHRQCRLTSHLIYDKTIGGLRHQFGVPTLLDAMWMQLTEAVNQNKAFRECAFCGEPFEIAPPTHRRSRKFCDNACKQRDYRVRQAKALRLRRDGKSLKQIANTHGTSVKTVKSWLGE